MFAIDNRLYEILSLVNTFSVRHTVPTSKCKGVKYKKFIHVIKMPCLPDARRDHHCVCGCILKQK